MHVIVGQGQLDTILHATPEDRRGFIEEAAGVLKHRKRKEKALLELDACEGNLTRLTDLLGEIRRQLKPLGRQAEVARPGGRRPGHRAGRPGPAHRRRPAHRADRARPGTRRRVAARRPPAGGRGAERGRARPGGPARGGAARRPARPREGPGDRVALAGIKERVRGTQSLATERVRNAQAVVEKPRRRRGVSPSSSRSRPRLADAGGADRRGGRQPPRRPRRGDRRPAPGRRTPPPRRSAGSPVSSAPPPTGARVSPGSTGRSTRPGPARPRPPTRSAASSRPARRRSPARPERSTTSPRSRPGSPDWTPARRGSTRSTRPPPRASPTSRTGWPRPGRRCSARTATGPR